MEMNEIERRSRSKKENLAKLENDLIRLKAIAKSKNVNPQTKDRSGREKQTKNPSTTHCGTGGMSAPQKNVSHPGSC